MKRNRRIVEAVFVGVAWTSCIGFAAPKAAQKVDIKLEAESAVEIQKPLRRITAPDTTSYPAEAEVVTPSGPLTSHGYLEMPVVKNHREGSATLRFQVATAGFYTVWARVCYLNKDSNYLHVSVNGGGRKALGFDSTVGVWHWVGGRARVHCHRGMNTLVLKDLAAGIKVDQILLTTEQDYSGSKRPLQPRR